MVAFDLANGKITTDTRKPKAEEFGKFDNKLGGVEFIVEEQLPGFGKGGAMLTKVTLTARKDDKELWKTELAGRPWFPPPP